MRAVVIGCGAVGARAVRQLASTSELEEVVVVDQDRTRADAVVQAVGPKTRAATFTPDLLRPRDVAVLALPDGHRELAETALEQADSQTKLLALVGRRA